MTPVPYRDRSIVYDILSMVPGWLFLLGLDPLMATVAGIPAAAILVAARVNIFGGTPVRGRIVCGSLLPMIGVFVTAALVFGSGGIALGMLLALSVIAVAEGWTRRSGRSFASRFPLLTGVLFHVISWIAAAILLSTGATAYPTETFVKRLSEAPGPPAWTARARDEAVALADMAVKEKVGTFEDASRFCDAHLDSLEELDDAEAPRGVYVTLYDVSGGTVRGYGRGGTSAARDVVLAVADALSKKQGEKRSRSRGPIPWSRKYRKTFVMIDVPGKSVAVTLRPVPRFLADLFRGIDVSLGKIKPLGIFLAASVDLEPGVDGLEVTMEGDRAVALPSDPITRGWLTPRVRSGPGKIRKIAQGALEEETGRRRGFADHEFDLRKFRTLNFGQYEPGSDVVVFHRGNLLFEGDLDRERLLEAMEEGTDWLSRGVSDDGRFHYETRPPHTRETKHYNLPRHAGAVYSLFAMYNLGLEEPQLRESGKRALRKGLLSLDYMARNLKSPDPEAAPEMLCFTSEKGAATSGATALGAIAVAEIPDPARVDGARLRVSVERFPRKETLEKMGRCMLRMIDADGAVFNDYKDATTQEKVEVEPLYFPGEVALALVRSHKITGDEKQLEGARRIADRQIKLFGAVMATDFPWPGDHWIVQALTELAELTGEESYAELAVLMGEGYVREQYPPQAHLYPDYRGAYRRVVDVPRTTRAASRGEALTAAVRAARLIGRDPGDFERALVEGSRHLIEQQFTPANSFFVPRSWDVQGGFRMGLVDNHLRIDNNQHALVGMIGALEALTPAD